MNKALSLRNKKGVLKDKKGFTLIEIIVVLVIIAILAAVSIPTMIGYVNDARGKAYAAEARVGLTAAQAVVTEVMASGEAELIGGDGTITWNDGSETTIYDHPTFKNMISDVSGATVAQGAATNAADLFSGIEIKIEAGSGTNYRVTKIVYTPDGRTAGNREITIENGSTKVGKVAASAVSSTEPTT